MKKKIITLLCVICISLILFNIDLSKATDYEWIKNASFEEGMEGSEYVYLAPNGFQTVLDGWDYTETYPYDSIEYFDNLATNMSATDGYTMQHFTFETIPEYSIVSNVSFIVSCKSSDGSSGVEFYAYNYSISDWSLIIDYYTLSTVLSNYTISIDWITGDSLYNVQNFILKFTRQNGEGTVYIDAVTVRVGYEYSTILSDFEITPYWFTRFDSNYVGVTNSESNSGNWSGYIIYRLDTFMANDISQNINFLRTDNATSFSLYAKTNSVSNVVIHLTAIFTDDTIGMDTSYLQPFNVTDGWVEIEFDLESYPRTFPPGKNIRMISIAVTTADEGSFIYIDDVSLIATIENTGISNFVWYLVPEPVEYPIVNNLMFTGITQQNYIFYGQVYDVNGSLTEEGTFTVTQPYGANRDGLVTDGLFNFVIEARTTLQSGKTEIIVITIILPSGIQVYNIHAHWQLHFDDTLPTPPPDGDGEDARTSRLIDWIVMFMVVFLPSLLISGGIYENNQQPDALHISPIFGIIAGLVLSIGIGVFTGLVPFWLLIVIIVAIIVLFIASVSKIE